MSPAAAVLKPDTSQWNIVDGIKELLRERRALIPLRGLFHLTKTRRNFVDGVLLRDLDLEEDTSRWIQSRSGGFSALIQRYGRYDSRLEDLLPPQHYPVRILRGVGSIASGKNIFLFFPQCIGLQARDESDVIGFEFVDIWSNLFVHAVLPCWNAVADSQSQVDVFTGLRPRLDKTITLASIFHEIGHRVGPFRVSPQADRRLGIKDLHLDILGELATDSLLVLMLEEFPEIAQFIVLQRLFWFPRRGFLDNPVSAQINEDNDSWLGAYLFNQFVCHGVLKESGGLVRVDWTQVRPCFSAILNEIDALGADLLESPKAWQDDKVLHWMKTKVEHVDGVGFVLPEGLRRCFERSAHIPEIPHFQAPVSQGVNV